MHQTSQAPTLPSLEAQQLMTHMDVFCRQIGARPTGSAAERRAAEYVMQVLDSLKIADVRRQPFQTPPSSGSVSLPVLSIAALGGLLSGSSRFGKLIGGLALIGGVANLIGLETGRRPVFYPLIATAESENIIARIPARGTPKRMVFIVAHLDSNKQRFLFPAPIPVLTKLFHTASFALALIGGASMLLDVITGKRGSGFLQRLGVFSAVLGVAASAVDEFQPFVEGANDNATALSVALGLAGAFSRAPLEHTEVTLLFTGAEEPGCNGIESYLLQYAPPLAESTFIDIEMVGTGSLCYVTEHGMSAFGRYHPAPKITALAAQVARDNPQLGVMGKPMTIIEEVANLRAHGYEAICVAGYGFDGMLPNWHRTSDTLDKIEPDVLHRAARYIYELVTALDQQ